MAALVACEEIRGRLLAPASRELGIEAGELGLEAGRDGRELRQNERRNELGWKELVERAHVERVDISATASTRRRASLRPEGRAAGAPSRTTSTAARSWPRRSTSSAGPTASTRRTSCTTQARASTREVDLGQTEGGFAQGLGWAALEDLRYDETGTAAFRQPLHLQASRHPLHATDAESRIPRGSAQPQGRHALEGDRRAAAPVRHRRLFRRPRGALRAAGEALLQAASKGSETPRAITTCR